MSDTLLKLISDSLEGVMMATFAAAPVALLVLAVDRTVGKWMTPHTRCWLWMVVAVRLLMPIAPGSSVSVQNLRKFFWEGQSTLHQVEQIAVQGDPETVSKFMSGDLLGITSPPVDAVTFAPEVSTIWNWEDIIVTSVLLLWLAGVVVVLLRAVVASLRFAWRLRAIPCVQDQAILDVVLRGCDLVGVGRQLRVKYVPGLPTPAIFGLFRPTLCLPKETPSSFSHAELRMIVIHEAMHVRRFDGYLSWLLTAVRAVHWFNPLAWFTIQQIETYREQACDDAVRRFTEPQERSVYTALLLRFAAGRPMASLGLLGLWFARPARSLTARLKAFAAAKNGHRRLSRSSGGVFVAVLALVGLTDAASSVPEEHTEVPRTFTIDPKHAWQLIDSHTQGDETVESAGKIEEEREYDLTQALKKIAEIRPEENARQWLLKYLYLPGLKRSVVLAKNDPNQITVTATPQGHDFFENLLDEVVRFGNTWQVVVETKAIGSEHVETIDGIDWQGATEFASPDPVRSLKWTSNDNAYAEKYGNEGLSLSMESVSFEYAPYAVLVLDQEKMASMIEHIQKQTQASLMGSPKVTFFSGQSITLSAESHIPFVTGVDYVKGELATAAQPDITILPEGAKLDVLARVISPDTLDLKCRLTLSFIDGVGEAKLPGQDMTIQTPKATRRTVSARCRMKRGETLLIAPLAGQRDGNKNAFYYYAITSSWFPDPMESDD